MRYVLATASKSKPLPYSTQPSPQEEKSAGWTSRLNQQRAGELGNRDSLFLIFNLSLIDVPEDNIDLPKLGAIVAPARALQLCAKFD